MVTLKVKHNIALKIKNNTDNNGRHDKTFKKTNSLVLYQVHDPR